MPREVQNGMASAVPGGPPSPPRLYPWAVLIIAVAAFGVLLPSFWRGIPSGHDFEFHMNQWMEVLHQWRMGILYPRWASLAHYGFGEPRFIFYPPVSWILGAALGSFLPWTIVPAVHQWIALALCGYSMFLLARTFLPGRDATFAALLYIASPYNIVIVYWRSDFGELLAGALLPLLLFYLWRTNEKGRETIIPLALLVAALWLTNLPSAVLATYSLALLAAMTATWQRSLRPLWITAAALFLGLGLAAYFIVPAAYEQRWVEISQVLSPGVRPQDNFLFTNTESADHNAFNRLISWVATAQIMVFAGVAFVSRRWPGSNRRAWATLAGWGAVSAFLMCRFSFVFYRILPELRFIQLPWRWLLCLSVPFALLVTMAPRRWLARSLACLIMLGALLWVGHRVQPPWWDTSADVAEMEDNQQEGVGYEGTDEYTPRGGDAYEIKKDAARVTYDGPGNARIRIASWNPEFISFNVLTSRPGQLVLKLFPYPAWRTEDNGRLVQTAALEGTGQMIVPVTAGDHQIRLRFVRTSDRTLGASITLGSCIVLLGVFFARRFAGSS